MKKLGKAIQNKIHGAEKSFERGFKRTAHRGGRIISEFMMTGPTENKFRGMQADKKREALLRKRESRANDKAMGY